MVMKSCWIASRALQKLLFLFLTRPQGEFYHRELVRAVNEPLGSVTQQLKKLEREGFLHSKRTGPLKHYFLNSTYPYRKEIESIVFREDRQEKLEVNLKKLLRSLTRDYHPDKIILFGSYAQGRVSPTTDLDLCIVKENVPDRYFDRMKEIAPLLARCDVATDCVVWKPSELQAAKQKNSFVREEILKKGKVLYERTSRRMV